MPDFHQPTSQSIAAPYAQVFVVTPNDGTDLTIFTKAIRVAGAGNVNLTTVGGQTVVCAFLAGETRQIRAKRILSTSTTATTIEGMA